MIKYNYNKKRYILKNIILLPFNSQYLAIISPIINVT